MLSDEMQAREQAVQQTGEFAPVDRTHASPSAAKSKNAILCEWLMGNCLVPKGLILGAEATPRPWLQCGMLPVLWTTEAVASWTREANQVTMATYMHCLDASRVWEHCREGAPGGPAQRRAPGQPLLQATIACPLRRQGPRYPRRTISFSPAAPLHVGRASGWLFWLSERAKLAAVDGLN